MNKSAIEKYAKYARRTLMELVTRKAWYYGVTAKEIYDVESESSDAIVIHGTVHSKKIKQQREVLIKEVGSKGFEQVVEEVAYTWFNRFAALRFMEVNEYLPTGVRVFSSIEPGKTDPDLLTHALDVELPVIKDEIYRFRDTHDDEGLFKYLLIAQCNTLNNPLPFLFETISDYTELLFPDNMLVPDSLIRRLVSDIPEEDWREIEIVGWLYQFYISEKKDQVIGKIVKKEDIPAATQLFTPKWIVQYMVENTLGRLWLEMHPDSTLRGKMQYYIENPDDKDIRREPRSPETITCMDDACGSGHILVYMFDILYAIYEEMGYVGREIPSLILKHNLYGIDVDRRAVQLSSFAIMMKALEKDHRFLNHVILPHLIEIQESNDIDLDFLLKVDRKQLEQFRIHFKQQEMFEARDEGDIFDWASDQADKHSLPPWIEMLQQLLNFFINAKNYGSLLIIPNKLAETLPRIHKMLDKVASDDFFRGTIIGIQSLVVQAELLNMKCDVCVTNPPYMGGGYLNVNLKAYSKEAYPNAKSDLFSMFIERNTNYVKKTGMLGFVTPIVWMFLSSFEKFRRDLLNNTTITSLIQLEYNAFEPACVPVCTFTISNSNLPKYSGGYINLSDFKGSENQQPRTIEAINNSECGWFSRASCEDFLKIPEYPIAYWVSTKIRDAFQNARSLGSCAETASGLQTNDNGQFLKHWYEISFENIDFNCTSREDSLKSKKKWFPHKKGGVFRKWYGNDDWVVNWENDGEAIFALARHLYGSPTRTIKNLHLYFKPGITWTDVSSSFFAPRIYGHGYIFDTSGPSIFRNDLKVILSFLGTPIVTQCLRAINPTLHFLAGNISALPFYEDRITEQNKLLMENIVDQIVAISREDWDNFEYSWAFERSRLLPNSSTPVTLQDAWKLWEKYNFANFRKMKALEEQNNHLWIQIYDLEDEVSAEVPDDQITIYRVDVGKDMRSFISFAIGCMMGRYSIDTPSVVYAGGNWDSRWKQYEARRRKMEERRQQDLANRKLLSREDQYEISDGCAKWNHSPSFPEDDDGIIPFLSDDYFRDDGTSRIIEFLRVTFGEKSLSENLQFLAENLLNPKRDESPTQVIRRYLCTQFFQDHCQTYKKRPIYWLFTSGPERAFQALIYMHRYTPSMLAKIRTDYLHELQSKIEGKANHLRQQVSTGTPKEKLDVEKQLTKIHKQQEELRKYDELLQHYADQQIEIDLDDGVKVNYAKFGKLLAPIPGMKQDED